MKIITVLSPAKLNLTLDIFPKKEKENYHRLNTIYHKISLYDEIIIKESPFFVLDGDSDCNVEDNLITKAWNLIQNCSTDRLPKVKVTIQKNIPIEAGLGGGSSNFAYFIYGYCELFNCKHLLPKIILLANKFGKDIPFFFYKNPIALGKNFGEKISSLSMNFSGQKVYIYQPNCKHSTTKMYKELQSIEYIQNNYTNHFLSKPSFARCGNDFDILLRKLPYFQKLSKYLTTDIHFCGSGSCLFGFKSYNLPFCKKINCVLL